MKRIRTRVFAAAIIFIVVVCMLMAFKPEIIHLDTNSRRIEITNHVQHLVARIKSEDQDSELVAELLAIAAGDYHFGAVKATVGLGEIGRDAFPVVNEIGDLLFSEDPYVSREAAYALAKLGPIASSQIPKLVNAINSPAFEADYAAFEALGNMGEFAKNTLPMLRSKEAEGVSDVSVYSLRQAIKKIESASYRLPAKD